LIKSLFWAFCLVPGCIDFGLEQPSLLIVGLKSKCLPEMGGGLIDPTRGSEQRNG
jgi:hypothetical protein